ncbi:DNA-methyltransferase [Clostridium sp. MT-14]|uniref:DNA-methyltransferase n=1 Tax=Clostridium sp. MT-14 TaxID=3348360 RepID=UPI0035F28901
MKIIYKDVFEGIKKLNDNTIKCCITSPPYYKCRNYGNEKQLGLEKTPEKYIDNLCKVFDCIKNKLTNDGNLFINIGDKYDKNKSLMLIPTNFATQMKKRNWILRNDIIWYKPNFQPSPVTDRLTNTYEHIFHFTKNKSYYYNLDSIRIPNKCNDTNNEKILHRFKDKINNSELTKDEKSDALNELYKLYKENKINKDARLKIKGQNKTLFGSDTKLSGRAKELQNKGYYFHCNNPKGKNPGDLLSINIKAYHGIHEAVFPEELIEPLIKCGSNKGDIVLDCFAGTGTTCKVADRLRRIGIGIELNKI